MEGWSLYAENPLISDDTDVYDGRPLKKYGMLKWQVSKDDNQENDKMIVELEIAHGWKRLSPTAVPWTRVPDLTSYLGWVCSVLFAFQGFVLGSPVLLPPRKPALENPVERKSPRRSIDADVSALSDLASSKTDRRHRTPLHRNEKRRSYQVIRR